MITKWFHDSERSKTTARVKAIADEKNTKI